MNRSSLCFAALLCLVPAVPHAQWYDEGKPVPDNDYRQQRAGFGVLLAVASDPEQFMEEWYNTKESHVPRLRETDHVKKGGKVGALILFSGCAPEGQKCDAMVDFRVLAPDGSVYGEHTNNVLWSQVAPKPNVVALSQANLMVRIEPKDPVGRYTVLVEVRSQSRKTTFRLKRYFEVDS